MLVLALIWLPHKCNPVTVWIRSHLNCAVFKNSYLHRTSSVSFFVCVQAGWRMEQGEYDRTRGTRNSTRIYWQQRGCTGQSLGASWLVNWKVDPVG